MAKQYCIRGHDTLVVGRVQRMCRECRRLSDRRRYQRKHRLEYQRRWWMNIGSLRRLNRMVDSAMQKMEAIFGNW
jgi:hypothetical protein